VAAAAAERLVRENVTLARQVVRHFPRGQNLTPTIDEDDLHQAALIGLYEAATRWDARTGVPFPAFARVRMLGAVRDELRSVDTVTRNESAKAKRNELVVGGNSISIEDLRAARLPISLGRPLCDADELVFEDLLVDGAGEDELDRIADIDELVESLATLPEREHLVLYLRFWEDRPLAEIAELLDVSEARVCQLQQQALGRLARNLGAAA